MLTQRVSTASTQPRTGQTPSQATISKLSTATYTYGKTLRQRGGCIAPDGEPCGNYPKGWRFLPVHHSTEVGEILKKIPRVAEAMRALHSPTNKQLFYNCHTNEECNIVKANYDARQHQIINNAHYNLVIAPQIKAQEEAIARKEEEERLAIATLKMRVQELEKKPTPSTPTITTSATSYLPLAVVGVVLVVILLFLRRKA